MVNNIRNFVIFIIFSFSFSSYAKEYGKHCLSVLEYKSDTFYCIFYPKIRPQIKNNEYWRLDTFLWNNPNVVFPVNVPHYQDKYIVDNNFLTLAGFSTISKQSYYNEEYDYDLMDSLNFVKSVKYTGKAICDYFMKDLDREYIIFTFENGKLLGVDKYSEEDFKEYKKKDSQNNGNLIDFLIEAGLYYCR